MNVTLLPVVEMDKAVHRAYECVRVTYETLEEYSEKFDHDLIRPIFFLDLKFHDIPATVYRNVKRAMKLGADFISVHMAGGSEMITEALRASRTNDEKYVRIIGYFETIEDYHKRWHDFSGLDGILAGDHIVCWDTPVPHQKHTVHVFDRPKPKYTAEIPHDTETYT